MSSEEDTTSLLAQDLSYAEKDLQYWRWDFQRSKPVARGYCGPRFEKISAEMRKTLRLWSGDTGQANGQVNVVSAPDSDESEASYIKVEDHEMPDADIIHASVRLKKSLSVIHDNLKIIERSQSKINSLNSTMESGILVCSTGHLSGVQRDLKSSIDRAWAEARSMGDRTKDQTGEAQQKSRGNLTTYLGEAQEQIDTLRNGLVSYTRDDFTELEGIIDESRKVVSEQVDLASKDINDLITELRENA